MSTQITFVYKISRYVPKTGQLVLGEYNTKGEEVKAMARLHTNGNPFVSGLMLATVQGEDKISFTFDRKTYQDDKELNEAVSNAKISYSTNVDASLLLGLNFDEFIKVPCDDYGVSMLKGFQLHVTVDSPEAIKSEKGVWTQLTTVAASSLKIVKFGDPDYVKVGVTVNILDFNDVYYNVRSKEEKASAEQIKEQAKANLKRVSSRSNRARKTSSAPTVSSVEENPTSASIMDQLKAMAAAAANSDSTESAVVEEKTEAKPSTSSRVSRFAQGGTL